MNERDRTYIERIKGELAFISGALGNVDKESFLRDEVIQRATSMSLITVGECANHLSEKFRTNYPHIQWIEIVAVRNIAAHGYWQLDMQQIWQAVIEDIPELIEFFEQF